MDETKKKLEYLLRKEIWDTEDQKWMQHYLDIGDVTLLKQISRQQYEDDMEKAGQVIDKKLSKDILGKIHRRIDIPRRRSRIYKISLAAAAVLLLLIAVYVYRDNNLISNRSAHYVQVDTRPGQRRIVVLADGTHVWLSPASQLKYPDKFTGKARDVELSGEAFFEVAKDATHPFVINSGSLKTKVLGTSFDINAYRDRDYSTVTVATGEVSVIAAGNHGETRSSPVELLPNQKVVFNKGNPVLTKEEFPDANNLLKERRNGHLKYRGAALSTVVEDLSVQYGVKIKINRSMEKCTYYGDFDSREDLQVSLKVLCLTLNAKLIKEGDVYIINGRGC